MRPRLFPSIATSFDARGYGTIDALSCVVSESLNGEYSLEMKMFAADPLFQYLEIGSIIAAKPNETDPNQAFCVESINKDINGEVDVYATHIVQFRSKLIPVSNFTSNTIKDAVQDALNYSLESNPFSFTTNKSSAVQYTIDTPRSFREVMGGTEGSLLDVYGGEYYYDNFEIELLLRRGTDNGVRIFYGKNMVKFNAEDEFNWDDSATGVLPYWYSEDEGLVVGDIQYNDYKDDYPFRRTVTRDFTDDVENKPSKADLETEALSWITGKGMPFTNLSVSFDDLVTDNKGKNISLGDTVHIINTAYGVNYESRIITMEYDVLLERYTNVEVGDRKMTINEAIKQTASEKAVTQLPSANGVGF